MPYRSYCFSLRERNIARSSFYSCLFSPDSYVTLSQQRILFTAKIKHQKTPTNLPIDKWADELNEKWTEWKIQMDTKYFTSLATREMQI